MGCIVSKLFLDFYIFFIFTRPLSRLCVMQVRVRPGAKIIKKNTKLDSKQTSNVPC